MDKRLVQVVMLFLVLAVVYSTVCSDNYVAHADYSYTFHGPYNETTGQRQTETVGDETLYLNYTDSDSNEPFYGDWWRGQIFNVTSAFRITRFAFYIAKYNNPGTVTVAIRETTGLGNSTLPTGNDLIAVSFDGDTLVQQPSYSWYDFSLGVGISLSANTAYAIVMRAPSGDATNRLHWQYDSSGSYDGGFAVFSTDGGENWAPLDSNTDDFTFKLYGYGETLADSTAIAYFIDGTASESFTVNGTYPYSASSKPQYFRFEDGREYWVGDSENDTDIYIFEDTTTLYTITFIDLAGALSDYPFVEARRYVNGTLRTVEKRRVDVEKKVVMYLVNGVQYSIVIKDGSTYTYGALLMTSTTTIQLTLKGIEFPKATLATSKYVRIYGERVFGPDVGYALSFPASNDYAIIPDSTSLNNSGSGFTQFTLECWLKTFSFEFNKYAISKDKGGGIYQGDASLEIGDGQFGLNRSIAFVNQYAGGATVKIEHTAIGAWYYVAVVKTPTTLQMYINGSLVDSQPDTTALWNNNIDLVFGSVNYTGFTTYNWHGVLDEVRVSDVARSASEISTNWNGGSGRQLDVDADTIALWHFEEGSGTTAYDETSNNNDGTLVNGVLWLGSTGNIAIMYQDTLELTNSVDIYINYKNGTNAYNATETSDTFMHIWASALNDIDYRAVVNINHTEYGVWTWRQYFPRSMSEAPWGLDFLGTSLPFSTSILIPAFLILFVAGCFSVINAEVAAFMAVIIAAAFTYLGWIAIAPGAFITAFALTVFMALVYAKRRIQT